MDISQTHPLLTFSQHEGSLNADQSAGGFMQGGVGGRGTDNPDNNHHDFHRGTNQVTALGVGVGVITALLFPLDLY